MARQRPSWYYSRQAADAQRREDYFRNRTPPTEDRNIESRGASTDLYYRSLIQIEGTEHLIYATAVRNSTLAIVTAAQAGLMTALPADAVANRLRNSGLKPTKIHWYRGRTDPIVRTTEWQTSVSIYHAEGSHRSMPFSRATGNFDANDLKQAFEALFGAGGTVRTTALGTVNGRAHITWETVSVSAQT